VKIVTTIAALRREVAAARARAGSPGPGSGDAVIGLVPTMGALHEGHLTLVDRSRELTEVTVLSVFVNPAQFGPGEDFDRYPRDLDRDAEQAERRGVALMFAPPVEEVYPAAEPAVRVVPGRLGSRLCGASRPGHFEGVATVVAKLFGMVQPDVAVFGQKDYQQATLIRRMAQDLDMAVRIEVAPVVREPDGLALSSRNRYLSADERVRALSLSAGLFAARDVYAAGESGGEALVGLVAGTMGNAGVAPEYVELVDPDTLDPLDRAVAGAVLAVAARVGTTRLIDNVILGPKD
jgi:pantoate--beta-alanine ligase